MKEKTKIRTLGFKIIKPTDVWQCDFCSYRNPSYSVVRLHEKTCKLKP